MPPENNTPPPTPNTPPPSNTPSPGAGAGDRSASEAFDSQFNDLDSLTPPPAAPPAAPAAPAKPGAAPAKPAAAAPASKPGAPAKPGNEPAPEEPKEFDDVEGIKVPRFKSDKNFRGWGLGGYKKAKQLETDLETLRAKHTELEQKVPKTETERKQLAERLENLEKQHAQVLEELNFSNYERSPEYKRDYEKPYQDAIARAHRDTAELTVTEEDRTQQPDADGKYPTRERPAKAEDFDQIYQLQLGAASNLAAKKFGPHAAPIVLQHRANIRQLAEKAVNALNEWKSKSTERAKTQEAQTIQTRERMNSLWVESNKAIKEKHKDLFDERADDKEWNEKLLEGSRMADAYFADRSAHPMEQRVMFDAQVRNRVAAFPAVVSRMRKLEADLAEAQKTITELRGSGPGKPSVEAPGGGGEGEQTEGALDAFDKKL